MTGFSLAIISAISNLSKQVGLGRKLLFDVRLKLFLFIVLIEILYINICVLFMVFSFQIFFYDTKRVK